MASMMPLELVTAAPRLPSPWMVPVLVMAPPVRLEVIPLSWTTPALVQALAMFNVPASGVTTPLLAKLIRMEPGPATVPVAELVSVPFCRILAPLISKSPALVSPPYRFSARPLASVMVPLLVAEPALKENVIGPLPCTMLRLLTNVLEPPIDPVPVISPLLMTGPLL